MTKYLYLGIAQYTMSSITFDKLAWCIATKENKINLSSIPIVKDYKIDVGEKLYFLPGVSIPRIKLKDLYKDQKAKTVRDITDATKIICGRRTMDTITDDNWLYAISVEKTKQLIDTCYKSDMLSTTMYESMMDMFSIYTEDVVLGDWAFIKSFAIMIDSNVNHESHRYSFIKHDYTDLYEDIKNVTLYDEECLISIVNSNNSTIIDEAMYESLEQMFCSNDLDNHVLAMEIMANSNYDDSLLYLCWLFRDHHYAIYQQKTRNHVNFKALCSYMGFSSPSYCNMDLDDIINLFINKDLFTKELGMMFLKMSKDSIEKHGSTDKVKVAKITFSDDVIEYLKQKENKHEPIIDIE